MTRRQAFTQSQLRAAAKIAKEHGVSVRLDADGSATISPSSTPVTDGGLDQEIEAFERRNAERDDFAAAIAKMDPNSRKILSGGYLWEYDDFKADVAKKPLNKRETATLEALSKFGVGALVGSRQVKIGPDTQDRLEARGYIETRPREKFPDRVGYYLLTKEGLTAYEDSRH
ncbi:hypothetical protein [Mesorhizobium sp. A623]